MNVELEATPVIGIPYVPTHQGLLLVYVNQDSREMVKVVAMVSLGKSEL